MRQQGSLPALQVVRAINRCDALRMNSSVPLRLQAHARPAIAPTIGLHIEVVPAVGVALRAVSARSLDPSDTRASTIEGVGNDLEMVEADAISHSAQVVEFKTIGHRAPVVGEHDSMHCAVSPWRDVDETVAVGILRAVEQPTRGRLLDLCHDPINRWTRCRTAHDSYSTSAVI